MHFSTPGGTRKMFHSCMLVTLVTWAALVDQLVHAGSLQGLVVREQSLQQPKTAKFISEAPGPIDIASFNGGLNIQINSADLNDNPVANQIYLESDIEDFRGMLVKLPDLNEDDAFNSNPQRGFITYRLPALHTALGIEASKLDLYYEMTWYLSVKNMGQHLECEKRRKNKCRITFKKKYTPLIHRLHPPVIYSDSMTQVYFQSVAIHELIGDLETDDKPFVSTEIDGSKLDHEFLVDHDFHQHRRHAQFERHFNGWGWNEQHVPGIVGEMPIGYKSDIKMLFASGYAFVNEMRAKTCTYDMKQCYNALTVPAIYDISANQGFKSGGQQLTIRGHGFEGANVKVTVAGAECKVTHSELEMVHCITSPVDEASPSVDMPQAGSYGVRNRFYNQSKILSLRDVNSNNKFEETLFTQLSVQNNIAELSGNWQQGWFVPPVTARYRFYITCDDNCEFKMGLDPKNPVKTQTVVQRHGWVGDRDFWTFIKDDKKSEWIELEQGKQYFVEAKHQEWSGRDHMAIGMEIEQTEIKNHNHQMKEIQYLVASPKKPIEDIKFEINHIVVDGIDKGGSYWLFFGNPLDPTREKYQTDEIPIDAPADTIHHWLKKYSRYMYQGTDDWTLQRQLWFGEEFTTELVKCDANGKSINPAAPENETEDEKKAREEKETLGDQTCTYHKQVDEGTIKTDEQKKDDDTQQKKDEDSEKKSDEESEQDKDKQKDGDDKTDDKTNGEKRRLDTTDDAKDDKETQDKDAEASKDSVVTRHIYIMKLTKLIPEGYSILNQGAIDIETETGAKNPIVRRIQKSDQPAAGSFRISCPIPGNDQMENPEYTTDDINIYTYSRDIKRKIEAKCPNMYDKIKVWQSNLNRWDDVWRWHRYEFGIYIQFFGINGKQTPMKILPGKDQPLTGIELKFETKKMVEASDNIFYEVVPFEMLRTYETAPQVMVKVGDLPAVCKNLTCDYKYIEPQGQIQKYTYTADSNLLEIEGINLPSEAEMIKLIEFADAACLVQELTDTKVTCTMESDLVCGDHLPKIFTKLGMIPLESTIEAQTVACSIDSADVTKDLNLLGGDNITLSGQNLPQKLDTNKVEITFDNEQKTPCIPMASNSKSITCQTEPFEKPGNEMGLNIKINDKEIENSLIISSAPKVMEGVEIEPKSVNPTLKTEILIKIDPMFPYELKKDDFSVNATHPTDDQYTRMMNIISVDTPSKTIKTMFGGAWSNNYEIKIRHKKLGLLKTDKLILEVGSKVETVTPTTGSIYGGTLVTIAGTNFGKEFTDNPVQVIAQGPLRTTNCFLEKIKSDEIKCRLEETKQPDKNPGSLIVFLKTSEEAVCQKETCAWTFTADIPEVTGMEAKWDESNNYWTVVVTGTKFTGTEETTDFYVNEKKQKTISLSDTEAVFRVTDIQGWKLSNMNLYFDVGLPKGYDTVIRGKTLQLTPKLISLSPNVGSIGGTLIRAKLEGVGPLMFPDQQYFDAHGVTLIDFGKDQDICESVTITKFGEIECITKAIKIAEGTVIGAKSLESKKKVKCDNSDQELCKYVQIESTEFPVVDEIISQASNKIVFKGKQFFTAGYNPTASYGGIVADEITDHTENALTAIWKYGLPPLSTELAPSLWFDTQKSETKPTLRHYAEMKAKPLAIELKIKSSSKDLQCSFAGGCDLQINADGLSAMIKGADDLDEKYNITVCEETCEFDPIKSDGVKTVCKLPKLSTTYSNDKFTIQEVQDDLKFYKTFGNQEDFHLVFDNELTTGPSAGSENDCQVGGYFKTDHIGLIHRVRYLMPNIQDKAILIGKLKFQGKTQDGEIWEDLFVADETIHEGWNYHEFEKSEFPKFSHYRLYNEDKNGCLVNELKLTGVETFDDYKSTHSCTVEIKKVNDLTSDIGTQKVIVELDNKVTYSGDKTPLLTSIDPRYGAVTGGEEVTFRGNDFTSDKDKYTILIDGIKCEPKFATSTKVTCITGKRPGLVLPSLEIYIDGKGLISNQGKVFRYVQYWSDPTTWGNEFIPMFNESIHVPPGLNLLVDVDSTPILNLVMVEGSLIFPSHKDPNHERFFDAKYIFLNKAYMEVGTEEFPYTSKLTITMHGDDKTPFIPTFGNKVLAVRESTLDMYGIERKPTWTVLDDTVEAGGTQIKLAEEVDWVIGEEIAIASTSYNPREAEKRTIKEIDKSNRNKPIITLNKPLEYKHFAKIQKFGRETIDTRAEVGLLTRNVKFRGDPETSLKNQYGAAIFLHSEGDDSLMGRLAFIELTQVGQAFKVGRYAVHFHMIGAVHKSYCKGLATHTGFNRAFTLHGTHYLRLMKNVVYDTKGHNIFIEDAIEKKNYIYKNLVIMAKRSWSLLNTDQTPACFWITNPDNNFIDNHCGGSDRYGYWYDLQKHTIAQSASTDFCPENERVGEFRNNHAHSCGRYGLRIFHNMIPRKYPCRGVPTYDVKRPDDPYHENPAITANFNGLTSWKNGRNGAIAEKVGDVRFNDFKVADNLLAGIEFSLTDDYGDNTTRIDNALIIGRTENTDASLEAASPFGIIGPRTENFRVDNVRFFNFDWNSAAALSSCSHCFHNAATDSGARTIRFSKLSFDSSVKRKINYQTPYRAIFLDEDGTLTGKGPGSWATPWYMHHDVQECERVEEMGGAVCDSTIQVRRLAFHEMKPASKFRMQGLYIMLYDPAFLAQQYDLEKYTENMTNWQGIPFKDKLDPSNGWAVPFVTGHKYRLQFAQTGLDYESYTIDASERWMDSDKSIFFVHKWVDKRVQIKFTAQGQVVENNTIPENVADYQFGQNLVLNDTETRETHFIINGKGRPENPYGEMRLTQHGIRCFPPCIEAPPAPELAGCEEGKVGKWSDPNMWPDEKIPEPGKNVTIGSGYCITYDLVQEEFQEAYDVIMIYGGKLIFDPEKDTFLKAKHILNLGSIQIGKKDKPFEKIAKIELYGRKDEQTYPLSKNIESGNKLIYNVGEIRMYGKPRWNMTRLLKPALKDQNEFMVAKNLDIVQGDRLGLLPTSYSPHTIDDVIVQSYDKGTGKVTIKGTLKYYHWGKPTSTAEDYHGLDMRGEVILLSRNIQIKGQDVYYWGGQILTSSIRTRKEGQWVTLTGSTIMDNVEIYNCSQLDNQAALRFIQVKGVQNEITNSAIHNGYHWGLHIEDSADMIIKNNIFFQFRPIGLAVMRSKNIIIDENVVAGIYERSTLLSATSDMQIDKMGAFAICTYNGNGNIDASCLDIKMRYNIAAGSVYAGFLTMGHKCGDYQSMFEGNVAHSITTKSGVGLFFKNHPSQKQCTEFSRFNAYKCILQGAYGNAETQQIIMSKMVMVDNAQGIGAMISNKPYEYKTDVADPSILMKEMKVYGEYGSPDCPQNGGFCTKIDKTGFLSSLGSYFVQAPHITMTPMLPHTTLMGEATWYTKVEVRNVHFKGFKAMTEAGRSQRIFRLHKDGSDIIPIQEFFDTKFEDCDEDALAYLYDPPQKWANPTDCGNFPCTGPWNTFYSFKGTTFNTEISFEAPNGNFQLLPDTPQVTRYIPNCSKKESMNAWICTQPKLGILQFESQDFDKMDRSMQPIYAQLKGTDFNNKVNSFMDHVWDGFYTGQVRLSRFPMLVYAPKGAVYDIVYTGTPAKKMKYMLLSSDKTIGMTVRIAYPSTMSRQILKDGKKVEMNKWDDDIRMYGEIKQEFCGENRYVGVKNILEFFITPDCNLQITPRDAIQTLVRMDWTLNEFFADGGTTQFVDRVAGSLGIHASTIKVVSVYEGSVVVIYDITLDDEEDQKSPEEKKEALKKLQDKQTKLFSEGELELGAPILDVQVTTISSTDETSADELLAPTLIIKDGNVVGADPNIGLIVGIIIASIFFVYLLAFTIYACIKCKQKRLKNLKEIRESEQDDDLKNGSKSKINVEVDDVIQSAVASNRKYVLEASYRARLESNGKKDESQEQSLVGKSEQSSFRKSVLIKRGISELLEISQTGNPQLTASMSKRQRDREAKLLRGLTEMLELAQQEEDSENGKDIFGEDEIAQEAKENVQPTGNIFNDDKQIQNIEKDN